MSKVKALYHIVFCTKNREMTIDNDNREQLYRFFWSEIKSKECYLYRISGTPNHIHILLNLNPKIALSDLMRDLKANSSGWLKNNSAFPLFKGWAKEYFAVSISFKDRNGVIEYIKSQQEHHNIESFDDELMQLCRDDDMVLYDGDLV